MTNKRTWREVDSYFASTLIGPDPALDEALAANSTAGLPSIDVSAAQGKLIHLLARMVGARKALEIGTLGGYSTIWLARALPDDGRLITLEVSARHADVARRNVARAGLESKVEIMTGAALTSCPRSSPKGSGHSTSCSLTRTKATTPPISNGLCAYRGQEPQSSSTMWCARAKSSMRRAAAADVVGVRRMFDLMANEPALKRDRDPDRRLQGMGRLRASCCALAAISDRPKGGLCSRPASRFGAAPTCSLAFRSRR